MKPRSEKTCEHGYDGYEEESVDDDDYLKHWGDFEDNYWNAELDDEEGGLWCYGESPRFLKKSRARR